MAKNKVNATHIIGCTECKLEMEVDIGVKAILCPNCTTVKMLKEYGVPHLALQKKPKTNGRPPGWHFYNEFVDTDGTVFHKGVEQPKLKGTKKPTKIKPKAKKKPTLSRNEKLKKQRTIFTEIQKQKRTLTALIKSGKKRGKVGLQRKILKLEKEVRKYL